MKIKKVASYYTPDQIAQYLEHIKFPRPPAAAAIESGAFPPTVANLATLIRLHLLAFPIENTAMYYTASHRMEVEPQAAFDRMVRQGRGYGSYCFGQNGLFLGVLRGLGYRAFSGGGRVNTAPPHAPAPAFTALLHMVLFAQTADAGAGADETFVVDVGYGAGPVRPIPLRAGVAVAGAAPPEEHRLVRARHPNSSLAPGGGGDGGGDEGAGGLDDAGLDWRLEMRCGAYQREWRVLYQFSTAEVFWEDYDVQNFAVSQRVPSGTIWDKIVCVACFEVSGQGGAEGHLGRMVMSGTGNKVDKRVGDVSETVAVFKTDIERLRALKEHFGINIAEHDISHIKGRGPALPR